MDRVVTLLEKLNSQMASQTSIDELVVTTQMILSELQHLKSTGSSDTLKTSVAIHISENIEPIDKKFDNMNVGEEKEVVVLQIDELEIDAELEQMKKSAEVKTVTGIKNRPVIQFDPFDDVPPTVIQQQKKVPVSENEPTHTDSKTELPSFNDSVQATTTSKDSSLLGTPIKDLKKAIGMNDRYLFINELFAGDETMYERSIKTINSFTIYPEAEYWIRRELKLKLAWDEKNETVKQFDHLVKRRFSVT